jgi:hypothetical protein
LGHCGLGHCGLGPCGLGHCGLGHCALRLAALAGEPLRALVEKLAVGSRLPVVAGTHALALPDRG